MMLKFGCIKKYLTVLLPFVLILGIAACGSQDTPPAQTGSESQTSEAIQPDDAQAATSAELVWSGWAGEEAATRVIIDQMMDSYPNANISWVGWPWAEVTQQILIRFHGSELIDVAQIDSSMFTTLIEAGALADLTDIFDSEWLNENFPEPALAFGQMDGVQYAMPWTTASIGMVYNPTLLAAVGFDSPPTTLDEFEEVLSRLREYDSDIIPYAISTTDTTAAFDFMPWLWAFGGSILGADGSVTIDSEEGIATLRWYQEMAERGYIRANISRFDARQLFAQGRVAFYDDAVMANGIALTNGVEEADLDATIQPMLRPVLRSGDAPTSVMWGHLLAIISTSDNKVEAADFIKHVLSDEQSIPYFNQSGMLPVMNSGLSHPDVINDTWAAQWSEITNYGRDDEFKFFPQNAELQNIISEELQAVIVGQKTPEEAAEAMRRRLSEAL